MVDEKGLDVLAIDLHSLQLHLSRSGLPNDAQRPLSAMLSLQSLYLRDPHIPSKVCGRMAVRRK